MKHLAPVLSKIESEKQIVCLTLTVLNYENLSYANSVFINQILLLLFVFNPKVRSGQNFYLNILNSKLFAG